MMHYEYEIIKHIEGLPIKAFFVSISSREYHWHSDLELVWILKGSVIIQLNIGDITLEEGDIYILNTNEVHCLKHTHQENLLLALQINEDIVSHYFNHLTQIQFYNNYISHHHELAIRLKRKMARIMISVLAGEPYDLMKAVGNLNLLLADLFKENSYKVIDRKQVRMKDIDLERLQRIIGYVNTHYMEKITLQDLADTEFLSRYRMSHFIKEKLGINFQSFINRVRMEKAVDLILQTDKNILDISVTCGFSDIKYLNKMLKEEYNMTATGIRKKSFIQENNYFCLEDHGHRQFDHEEAIKILMAYL